MFSKVSALLLAFALVLSTFGAALAQDAPQVFCGDLSADDCAILQQSHEAMREVAQYQAQSTYVATLTGIPGLPAPEVTVNVAADGWFAMDAAAMAASHELATMDTAAAQQVLAESPEVVLDLVNGWDFDMVLSAELPAELASALSAQAGVEVPTSLSLPVKLIDGVLYFDQSELAPFFVGAVDGWVGVPVAELLTTLNDQGVLASAAQQADPAALAQSGAGATVVGLGALQALFGDPATLEQFSSVERVDDADGAATFVTSFDWIAFFSSPEFQQAIVELANAGAFEGTGLTVADVEQNIGMLGGMAPMVFGGLTATATQQVELETNYQTAYMSELAWDLTSLIQMAAMSGQVPADMVPAGSQVAASFVTDIQYSDFATAQDMTFEAPADATMFTVADLIGVQQ